MNPRDALREALEHIKVGGHPPSEEQLKRWTEAADYPLRELGPNERLIRGFIVKAWRAAGRVHGFNATISAVEHPSDHPTSQWHLGLPNEDDVYEKAEEIIKRTYETA